MNTDTKVFLKKRLKEYYWKHEVNAPNEVHRREFGVGTLDDKIKFRHKSFRTERELNQYLKTEAPYYISYSTAYYEFPRQDMGGKNWLGADLIFDLDKPMLLLDQKRLDEVRDEATNLVDFLLEDFSFAKQDIRVNFSGSKGYHIHVISDEVKPLGADARREIIDYISGNGLDIEYFIKDAQGARGVTFERGKERVIGGSRIGPKRDSKGWARRVYNVTERLINSSMEELQEMDGVGRKTAERIVAARGQNIRLLNEGMWDALWSQFKSGIKKQVYSKAVCITDDDKQVTSDISRLIRLPDTIHGGSGLLAMRVNDLGSFNPLLQAVVFKGEKRQIRVIHDVGVFQMMGQDYGPYASDTTQILDEYAAVYLMLKDKAEIA